MKKSKMHGVMIFNLNIKSDGLLFGNFIKKLIDADVIYKVDKVKGIDNEDLIKVTYGDFEIE